MSRISKFAVLALATAAMAATPVMAWQRVGGPGGFAPYQGRGPGGGDQGGRRGPRESHPHIGQWLQKNRNLTPEQQEKALAADPDFQKLPPERQQHLIERLRQFNSLPSDKRQRMLARMDAFEHLTPEQQQQARQIFAQVRQMPDERRQQFRKGMRQLADMPPEQRHAALDSPEFRNNYTDNERNLMRQVVQLNILSTQGGPDGPPPPPEKR